MRGFEHYNASFFFKEFFDYSKLQPNLSEIKLDLIHLSLDESHLGLYLSKMQVLLWVCHNNEIQLFSMYPWIWNNKNY